MSHPATLPEDHDRSPRRAGKALRRLRSLGLAGFLFFLIKGLLWLLAPAVFAAWAWLQNGDEQPTGAEHGLRAPSSEPYQQPA